MSISMMTLFTDAGCDHAALRSAVDVLRIQQAQPHRSMEHMLWEAIKDYADRAKFRGGETINAPPQPLSPTITEG